MRFIMAGFPGRLILPDQCCEADAPPTGRSKGRYSASVRSFH